MTSNRKALILLLLVACSCPLFSDRKNCRQTEEFDMGVEAARDRKYRVLHFLGWGVSSTLIMRVFAGTGMLGELGLWILRDTSGDMDTFPTPGFLFGAGIGTALSIVIPAMLSSRPPAVPEHISEDKVECYLDGYDRETRRNRIRGALLGCAVSWIFLLAEGFAMQ